MSAPYSANLLSVVYNYSPALQPVANAASLQSYFQPAAQWQPEKDFPLRANLQRLILNSTDRLYGGIVRDRFAKQLDDHFIAESGTHLSFPREYDDKNGLRYDNTLVTQGQIVSAALYHYMGAPYHFGFYSSRVSADNTNGAKFLQITPDGELFQAVSSNKAKNSITAYLPPLDAAQIADLDNQTKRHTDSRYPHDVSLTILQEDVIGALRQPNRNGEAATFVDQVAAVQKRLSDQILPASTPQIVVDYFGITRRLMIDALRDENSLTYQVFADPALRSDFIESLADIRSGWRKNSESNELDSPFLKLNSSGQSKKSVRLSYSQNVALHDPHHLADQLEQDALMPTNALEMAFLMSETGLLMHGGMFQANYNSEIKVAYQGVLNRHGYAERADALGRMPVHIATQSPAFGLKSDERLLNVSDFLADPVTDAEFERIPQISGEAAMQLAAPTLWNFFGAYVANTQSVVDAAYEQRVYQAVASQVVVRP
jgi:hypothetical protein